MSDRGRTRAQSVAARHSIGKKIALSIATAVILALLLEAAVRLRQYGRYGTLGQIEEFAIDGESGLPIPPPNRRTATVSINSRGFRGPEIDSPKPAGRIRIAFLGASTTYCAEVSCDAATWPARVVQQLGRAIPDCSFDYVNAGVAGYTLEQTCTNLLRRVAQFDPDVIIHYEANNDLIKDSRELAIAQGVYTGHSDHSSWIADYSLAWYLLSKNLLLRQRQDAAKSSAGKLMFVPHELSRGFRDRLTRLVEAAKPRARVVALLTFATHARAGQSQDALLRASATSIYYMPYMSPQILCDAFDEYNQVIREVADANHVLLLDTARSIPGDDALFHDSIHFTDAGCIAIANEVVAGLLGSPEFRALCSR